MLYECVQRGGTPTGSMLVVAISISIAMWLRGPSGDPKPNREPPKAS